ncbi:MAG: nitrous oxide reductase family maturation protein NosD [Saprospiraceae bacterium]|nr:nitrous oxide reductase family maturation protein NosD [Saprospiraceae bacterium]
MAPQLSAKVIDLCPTCTHSELSIALNHAHNKDTILITGGSYECKKLEIAKSITIIGRQRPHIVSADGDEIFVVTADSVRIIGLFLSGVVTNYLKENAAIRIRRSKHFELIGNTIQDCFFGIYLEHAKQGILRNNSIEGAATTELESGNAIHAWYCDSLIVEENYVSKHRDGIYLEFVNNSLIAKNTSKANTRYGLHFMFSNDDKYLENTFTDNGVGVAVMFSSRIQMTYNEFSFNWGRSAYGLLLKEMNDANIAHNSFYQNTIGIFVEGSNRINYTENTFSRNGWAIKFSGGCSANEITRNNFVQNSLDLIVGSSISDNRFHHNFWSSYTGYDLDKDQIGDVPHYPVKLFSYVLDQVPEAIVLMRSLFVDILNFAEKVSPIFTPKEVLDPTPLMNRLP